MPGLDQAGCDALLAYYGLPTTLGTRLDKIDALRRHLDIAI